MLRMTSVRVNGFESDTGIPGDQACVDAVYHQCMDDCIGAERCQQLRHGQSGLVENGTPCEYDPVLKPSETQILRNSDNEICDGLATESRV